ncbi:Gfo/Idh/MocA family oxidoreductase [Patescibacteria group bacterium]|nr:Gfo/Idh/MocA family oxidoreductase [Patescibacteria group bacterium]
MKQTTFALFGLGKFGKNYYRLLRETDGIFLKSVVTQSSKNKTEVLRDPSVTNVIIATPPSTHFNLAMSALQAKKHVLLEKPMVLNVREAKLLKNAVQKSGTTFMVGYQYLYNDSINFLKKEIDGKKFGELSFMLADHFSSPPRQDVNSFWDAAPHALSIFQYLFRPTKIIRADMHHKNNNFFSATVRFNRGPLLCIRTAWTAPEKIRKITLAGTKQAAILDETLAKNKLAITNIRTGHAFYPPIKATEPLKNELQHFMRCAKTKQKPRTNVDFGLVITTWLEIISKKRPM